MKFNVIWSEEDGEWVGLCDKYPSLSHLDKNKNKALEGIKELVKFVEEDLCKEAEEGEKSGYLGAEKSEEFLKSL